MPGQIEPVTFDPFAPGFTDDPYPVYRELRERDPAHRSPLGFWALFRHEDVLRVLRDPALSVEDRNATPGPLQEAMSDVVGEMGEQLGVYSMLDRDPPDHTRLRRLVSKAFTPRTIEGLRPRIEGLVDDALDRADEGGSMDLIADLAFPLPFQVITEMLGMPDTDQEQLRTWSGTIVRSLEPVNDPEVVRAIGEAATHMRALVVEAIEHKRTHPGDDLLTALVAAEEEGDALSDEELIEQVILLYIAGHETTVNLIGNGVLALLRYPEEMQRLRDDPGLDVNAVEELLRYDPPVQMSRRITLTEIEVAGRTIEPGSFVALVLASANRDLAKWGGRAEELDVGRQGASQHLAFGGGVHHCLGAALARLEAQIAIGTLVRRFPDLAMAAEPVWNGRINLRGLERLSLDTG